MKKTQKKIWKNTIKNLKKSKMKPHLLFDHYSPLRGFTLSSVHRSEEKKRNTISLLVLSPFVVHRSLRSLVARSLVSPKRSLVNPKDLPPIQPIPTSESAPVRWTSRYLTQKEKKLPLHKQIHTLTHCHTQIYTHM